MDDMEMGGMEMDDGELDDVHRASELEEKQQNQHKQYMAGMAAIKRRKPVRQHDGYCINCGKESPGAYCDLDCKEDAERFDRAEERNGCKA